MNTPKVYRLDPIALTHSRVPPMSRTPPNLLKTKRLLTWAPNYQRPGGRWKKQVDGKVHFFGHADSRDNSKAYKAALDTYLNFLQRRQKIHVPHRRITLQQLCEKLLQHDQERYQQGDLTANSLNRTRACLRVLLRFLGPATPLSQISELALEDYRSHILRQTDPQTPSPIQPSTARARLAAVKHLFRWAFQMRLCDMPRNILTYAKVRLPQPKVERFTLDQLRILWNAADERLRCFMALALNCGLYQKDISDLKMQEVDWEKGTITRPRGKTQIQATYKLWPMTLKLMKEHRDDSGGERVFLNRRGRPLLSERMENGRLQRRDTTRSRFWRLLRSLGMNGDHRGFSTLRNTAATEIERIDPAVTEMFLCHSEKGMKKHYAERDWKRLHAAQEQLERVLGLTVPSAESEKPAEPMAEGSWSA
jgi:integrase